ncbi:MAG: hypothetical protein K9H12_08680, partial [Bacteroidales bacterium]|nr:hypothetical protein [Bacteroidales bacterium]
MRTVILIIFSYLVAIANGSEPVDFNPNLLSKVIKKAYNLSDFRMYEIIHKTNTNERTDNSGKYYKYQSVGDKADSFYVYIGRVYSCRVGGCD